MVSDGLSCSEPLCDNLVWLSVFMRYIAAGSPDGHSMSVGTVCAGADDGVIVIRVTTIEPRMVIICVIPAIWRVRHFSGFIPWHAMVVVALCTHAGTVAMARHFISSEEGEKMKVFQILNNQVTIIQGSKVYIDSLENFKTDSGVDDFPGMVLYDESQKCCVVDSLFYNYPNDTYEGYLAKLPDYLDAKAKREYVPPAEPTVEEKKTALTADYNSGVKELSNAYNIATLRGDTEAQASIKQDFSDLQEAYKAEMEALQ